MTLISQKKTNKRLASFVSLVVGMALNYFLPGAGTAIGATGTAAASQFAGNVVTHNGNFSHALKDMRSKKAMRSLIAAAATANFGGSSAPISSLEQFVERLPGYLAKGMGTGALSAAIQKQNILRGVTEGATFGFASAVGNFGATNLGRAYNYGDGQISYAQHKLGHMALGGALGAIISKDRLKGALIGGLSAGGAEIAEEVLMTIVPEMTKLHLFFEKTFYIIHVKKNKKSIILGFYRKKSMLNNFCTPISILFRILKSEKHVIGLFLLLACPYLSGCNDSKYANCRVDANEFKHNGKAIVVTRPFCSENFIFDIKWKEPVVYTTWRRIDQDKSSENKLAYSFYSQGIFGAANRGIYMLEPGSYVVEHISMQIGNVVHSWDNKGWVSALQSPVYASFEIKPGEVVYIGDLEFIPINQRFDIRVHDKFDEANQYLREQHPQIETQMIKRLAKPGVSITYNNR